MRPIEEWYTEALHWHTLEFLKVLDEVHGPQGAGPWGGSLFITEMCRHLNDEPNEAEFKRVVGWVDDPQDVTGA